MIVEQNNAVSTPERISLRSNPAQPAIFQPETFTIGVYQWASGGGDDIKDTAQSLRSEAEHSYQVVVPALSSKWAKGTGGPSGDEVQNLIWEMSHASEVVRESSEKAPTLQQRMGTGGNQIPLVGVRRLTPTECERLQGFPDGWTAGQSDSIRYRQLGNAVAVPVANWIGKRIMAVEV